MLRITFVLILTLGSAAFAADNPCRTGREIATAAARYKALAEIFEGAAASVNVVEKAYFGQFESQKSVMLSGTVAEFQWTNPRARILLSVNGTENWTIEMNALAGLIRIGWRSKTLTPGMPITVEIHQLRDGSNGGHLLSAILPDGTRLSGGRDCPEIVQELRESAAVTEAKTQEYLKKNQLLGCKEP